MKEKVLSFIKRKNLIKRNDRILVALSGGPDSVCLLKVLYDLRDTLEIEVAAAHVNHMLRGQDAENDEVFTKNLCDKLNIEYYCKKVDIDSISKKNSISHELAGRQERYKFFEELSSEKGFNKIAVAHNLNDNAETVLMRIMRGTGLDGLIGIKVKRDDKIIRPILCLTRKEIERFIEERKLETCLDKSNFERDYSRNKVRLDILPYMEKNFNEDVIESINRMSAILSIDNDYIENQSEQLFDKYVDNKGKRLVISKEIFIEHMALLSRVIRKSLIVSSGNSMNFEFKHINQIIDLQKSETGKQISLPNNIVAENSYGNINFKRVDSEDREEISEEFVKKHALDGCEKIFVDYSIKLEKILNKNNKQISNNDLIKYFDYDKIKEGMLIRKRINGDKFRPLGMKGSKKLKDIFIDLKVPREDRDITPLICFDNEIAWIVGYKVSESYRVTNETNNILKISISRKE